VVNFGPLLPSNNAVKNSADVSLHGIKLTPVHAHVSMRIDLSSLCFYRHHTFGDSRFWHNSHVLLEKREKKKTHQTDTKLF